MFLFFIYQKEDFEYYFFYFNVFIDNVWEDLNDNFKMLVSVYQNFFKLNKILLYNDFQVGIVLILEIQNSLEVFDNYMDEYCLLFFEFKYVYLYFVIVDFEKVLDFFNNIVFIKNIQLLKDLQIYVSFL